LRRRGRRKRRRRPSGSSRTDATAVSKKAKKEERYRAAMAKLEKLPPCLKLCRGEECSGIPCEEEEPSFTYAHIDDMVVCQDKAHLFMATRDGCLLFHLWPARKRSPKPGPLAGHPPAKNLGGGTSGARQAPQNRSNQRVGKPRQAGKGTQQQQQPRGQQRQQQQSNLAHQRAIEKLNLRLEVARANASVKTIANMSYANIAKGTPSFPTPLPPPTSTWQGLGKDDELTTVQRGIMAYLSKRQL
jgi:hypothetical protein